MNIAFNFKNFDPSDHLKNYALSRFEKLSKVINNVENTDIQVNLSVERFRQKAEVVVVSDNIHISAYEESEDMYSTVDMILDKVLAQVKKMRDKQTSKRPAKTGKSARMEIFSLTPGEGGETERTIVETDNYEPKPMDVEEAAMQLESMNYDFLVFRNAETERVNVIYRRKNNDFGLIDPGV